MHIFTRVMETIKILLIKDFPPISSLKKKTA